MKFSFCERLLHRSPKVSDLVHRSPKLFTMIITVFFILVIFIPIFAEGQKMSLLILKVKINVGHKRNK